MFFGIIKEQLIERLPIVVIRSFPIELTLTMTCATQEAHIIFGSWMLQDCSVLQYPDPD
jgi:hypothetical protein